jgi:hypothetical protein
LVNGGGAITLQFQRAPFRPLTRTIFVPWNQIIVLPPVQMKLVDESDSKMPKIQANTAYSFLNALEYKFYDGNLNDTNIPVSNAAICPDHDHELLRPTLTSTWMPNAIGSMAGRSAIFAENQVNSPLRYLCICANLLMSEFMTPLLYYYIMNLYVQTQHTRGLERERERLSRQFIHSFGNEFMFNVACQ